MWQPEIDTIDGPRYLAIAEALGRDLARGRVEAGDRLPTHRDLAAALGVTVGTVSRAYAEARRRGLVHGHVGRGTFVGAQRTRAAIRDDVAARTLDLSINCPHTQTTGHHLRRAFDLALRDPAAAEYRPQTGSATHKEAAASWLQTLGLSIDPSHLVITAGAQHGICVAMAGLVQPGDTVLTESFTYAGTLALAKLLRIRLVGVASDAQGVCPDALAQACARHRPRAVYLTPTLQNPTATVMPDPRRALVAQVLQDAEVPLVEDGVYAFLDPDGPPPIAPRMEVGGHFVTSVSKSLAGGLRIGYLACPGPASRAAEAMEASTLMAPGIAAEAVQLLMRDGTLAAVEAERRREAADRQRVARSILGEHCHPDASELAQWLWLRLPTGWSGASFATLAQAQARVKVASNGVFQAPEGPAATTAHARVSLVPHADIDVVRDALVRLRDLLDAGPSDAMAGC